MQETEQPGSATADAPEQREREEAWRRGEARTQARANGEASTRDENSGRARASVAARAFAALADNVRDYAIFLMDPDGIITFWGEGARFIKWWTKDQAEGGHLRMLYPAGGSNDGTAEAHLREAAARGEYTGEGQRIRSDGSLFWAGVTLTALWDEEGTLLGFAKVTRDLTARRAADALLQSAAVAAEQARADAVAASMAKSGFLASMSHEIRTPINAILGYHELLALDTAGELTPGQRAHLTRATASARHLLSLITEVLDFSRLESEHEQVRPIPLRIGDAVAAALDLVRPQANARGIELGDEVSGYASGLAAWGEETRVRQILVNLLANAVKFTRSQGDPSGSTDPGRITVSAGTATQASPDARLVGDGPWVYVRVQDTGIGIPVDRQRAVFEPFVQADMSHTRTHGGAGLGLAISRRLARLMGGDITLRSESGAGSTFVLWLPAAPVESLRTGGVQGHGPGSEVAGGGGVAALVGASEGGAPGGALRGASQALLGELERVVHAYVARLRSDPGTPSAHFATEGQVEDHVATLITDLAAALQHLDGTERGSSNVPPGDPSPSVRDSTAIQLVVSQRHGAQRARLGWSQQQVRRDFTILREELGAAIRRSAIDCFPGPTPEARRGEAERSLELLREFVAIAERVSLESFRVHSEQATSGESKTDSD
jgi:PAS domain S-box